MSVVKYEQMKQGQIVEHKNDVSKEPVLNFRSSLAVLGGVINELDLTKEHKKMLRKTPFWNLFEAFIEKRVDIDTLKKNDKTAVDIIARYSPARHGFMLGEQLVRLTAKEVALILGIESGGEPMNLVYGTKKLTPFVERRGPSKGYFKKSFMHEQLMNVCKGKRAIDIQVTVKLLCLYACQTLLFTTSGDTVAWVYLQYIEDIDKMKTYAWSQAICDMLMYSVAKNHAAPHKVIGCVVLLPIWLCEHTKLIKPKVAKGFPRFVKWNLPILTTKMKKRTLESLTIEEVHTAELQTTANEEDILADRADVNNNDVEVEKDEGFNKRDVEKEQVEDDSEEEAAVNDDNLADIQILEGSDEYMSEDEEERICGGSESGGDVDEAASKIKSAQAKIKSLELDNSELKLQLRTLEEIVQRVSHENVELHESIDEHHMHAVTQLAMEQSTVQNLRNTIRRLNEEVEDHKEQKRHLLAAFNTLRAAAKEEVSGLRNQISNLMSKIAKMKKAMEDEPQPETEPNELVGAEESSLQLVPYFSLPGLKTKTHKRNVDPNLEYNNQKSKKPKKDA